MEKSYIAVSWPPSVVPMETPEPEKRTPAIFHRGLLEVLNRIDPAFEQNRSIKGRLREFVRPHQSGLTVSINTLTRPSSQPKQKQYDICIALLVAPRPPATYLCSPLWAGHRFDHNMNLAMAYLREAHETPIPASIRRANGNYVFRSNTFELLENELRFAEEVLLPFYLARIHSNAQRVAAVYRAASDILSQFGEVDDFVESDVHTPVVSTMSERPYLRDRPFNSWSQDLRREAFILSQFPWHTDRIQLAALPSRRFYAHNIDDAFDVVSNVDHRDQTTAIALDCLPDFLAVRAGLTELAERVDALRG